MGTPRDVDRKETGVIFSGEGAIGRLLPPQLWGVHAPFVEEALAQERAGRWVAARQRECLLEPEEDRG